MDQLSCCFKETSLCTGLYKERDENQINLRLGYGIYTEKTRYKFPVRLFQVLDMDIEYGVGCARDYLQVGVQERLCGRRIPGEIRE